MAYFYFISYILAIFLNGCFWNMSYPVSPYAYPRLSVPVSMLFSLLLPIFVKCLNVVVLYLRNFIHQIVCLILLHLQNVR